MKERCLMFWARSISCGWPAARWRHFAPGLEIGRNGRTQPFGRTRPASRHKSNIAIVTSLRQLFLLHTECVTRCSTHKTETRMRRKADKFLCIETSRGPMFGVRGLGGEQWRKVWQIFESGGPNPPNEVHILRQISIVRWSAVSLPLVPV